MLVESAASNSFPIRDITAVDKLGAAGHNLRADRLAVTCLRLVFACSYLTFKWVICFYSQITEWNIRGLTHTRARDAATFLCSPGTV